MKNKNNQTKKDETKKNAAWLLELEKRLRPLYLVFAGLDSREV